MRPTSGKTRETLFNWLQFDIARKTVLDPFSGSGALGIEAISRGAKKTFLIEKNIKVFKSLKSNLELHRAQLDLNWLTKIQLITLKNWNMMHSIISF